MILISWLRWEQTSYDENDPNLTGIRWQWKQEGKPKNDVNSTVMLIICVLAPIFFFPTARYILSGANFSNLPLNEAIKKASSDKSTSNSPRRNTHRFFQPEIDLMRHGIGDDYVKTHLKKVTEVGIVGKVLGKKASTLEEEEEEQDDDVKSQQPARRSMKD